MSPFRLISLLAAVLLVSVLGPTAGFAVDCEPTPAESEDLEFIAEQEGIELEEAVERYGWQTCFAEIATSLSERHPDDYAGAAIVDDGRAAWIAFRGEVPAEAAELAAEVPVPVDLIGDRGFAEAELDETLRAVHGAVSDHPDVATSSGGYDIETGHITILAQPHDDVSDDEREQLRDALQPEQPENEAVTVEVDVVDDIGAHPEDALAGLTEAATDRWPWLVAAVVIIAAIAAAIGLRRRSDAPSSPQRP